MLAKGLPRLNKTPITITITIILKVGEIYMLS